jgi:hypothetical protein
MKPQKELMLRVRKSGPKKPTTTQVVYKREDGGEEIRYTRPYGSAKAKEFEKQVAELNARDGDRSPYSIRHV